MNGTPERYGDDDEIAAMRKRIDRMIQLGLSPAIGELMRRYGARCCSEVAPDLRLRWLQEADEMIRRKLN
jgi:hypothetical protein